MSLDEKDQYHKFLKQRVHDVIITPYATTCPLDLKQMTRLQMQSVASVSSSSCLRSPFVVFHLKQLENFNSKEVPRFSRDNSTIYSYVDVGVVVRWLSKL